MVELVLREAGWRAESHGPGNPAATLAVAIRERRPDLFWLSASTMDSESQWLSEYQVVAQAAAEEVVPIAVGGRALSPELRQKMSYSAYCDSLRHLVGFAEAITP
jgi:methanogenic corrinoid protein MtbC1